MHLHLTLTSNCHCSTTGQQGTHCPSRTCFLSVLTKFLALIISKWGEILCLNLSPNFKFKDRITVPTRWLSAKSPAAEPDALDPAMAGQNWCPVVVFWRPKVSHDMSLHPHPCTFIIHSRNNKWIKMKFKCDYWHGEPHRRRVRLWSKVRVHSIDWLSGFTHITSWQDTQSSVVRMGRKAGKASQIRKSSEWTVLNGWALKLFKTVIKIRIHRPLFK